MKYALVALCLLGGSATVPNGVTRTPDQWRRYLGHAIEQREAALATCFGAPSAKGRTAVKVAVRGPLRPAKGVPAGSYSGWGHTDALFYVGQMPLHPGDPQPPDDELNGCLADALEDIPFPYDENNAVDATWVITYVDEAKGGGAPPLKITAGSSEANVQRPNLDAASTAPKP